MKNRVAVFYAGIAVMAFLVRPASAQWVQMSGPGAGYGKINSIFPSGTAVFVGTGNRVFSTTNAGAIWVKADSGINSPTTNWATTSFTKIGQTLFAATNGGGIFRSTNNGATWAAADTGLLNRHISALASSGSILFAGSDSGVFLSTNSAATWNLTDTVYLSKLKILALAIGVTTHRIYASTSDHYVWSSVNNGAQWNNITSATLGFSKRTVLSLAAAKGYVFAGTDSGAFRLQDGNTTWTDSGLTKQTVQAIAAIGDSVFAGTKHGLFISTNTGKTWSQTAAIPNEAVTSLAVIDSTVFAGTESGKIFISTNKGASWTDLGLGSPGLWVTSIAESGGTLFAGCYNLNNYHPTLFQSTNNGLNWADIGLWPNIECITSSGNNLYLATDSDGVFRSTDNGVHWSVMSTGLRKIGIWTVAAFGGNLFAGGEGIFSRYVDSTAQWQAINVDATPGIVTTFCMNNNGDIFMGGNSGGVFRSTNQGETWTKVGSSPFAIWQLIANEKYIVAGTSKGVYRSSDNGATWGDTGLSKIWVTCLASYKNNIFAGTDGSGIFLSNDNGASWTAVNTGLTNLRVFSIITAKGFIFTGTDGSSVFRRPLSEFNLTGIVEKPGEKLKGTWDFTIKSPGHLSARITLEFVVHGHNQACITVYNLAGHAVQVLMNKYVEAGAQTCQWDARALPSGHYLVQLRVGSQVTTKHFTLMR